MRYQCEHCTKIVDVDDGQCGNMVVCGHCSEIHRVPLDTFAASSVVGDFVIRDMLGQGSTGTVYWALQMSMDRRCALKVLAQHLVDDQSFVGRFLAEARVAARLRHVNVVATYAVGEENGIYFVATELISNYGIADCNLFRS